MIIVTGGAGFVGSHLIQELNNRGENDIIVVDDLTDSRKFKNLVDLKIIDYVNVDNMSDLLSALNPKEIKSVFHLGAISSTQEKNGKAVMKNNYDFSLYLMNWCVQKNIPLIYASSASVYGMNKDSEEVEKNEKPITIYGYSKLLFDQKVREYLSQCSDKKIVGLRFFNVYGANEGHKDEQASPFYRAYRKLKTGNSINFLVGETGTKTRAEDFIRDFIYVEDAVDITLWFSNSENKENGIYNIGTGIGSSFKEVYKMITKKYVQYISENIEIFDKIYNGDWDACLKSGLVSLKDFPKEMYGTSQPYTKANIKKLIDSGYNKDFTNINQGWEKMYSQLKVKDGGFYE